jgi:hypothetical protein
MGARRRTRQTGKSVPSQAVHARHSHHDGQYTWQQFRAEQAADEQEAIEREMAQFNRNRRAEEQAAAA